MNSWDEKVAGHGCRRCGSWPPELHHLLPRSKFSKRKKQLQDHPNNCIPLCHRCHQDHHTTTNRVPRKRLREEELGFLEENIHPGWIDKWYPEEE